MDMENMKKLPEGMVEGMKGIKTELTEVKTSQAEMKTGLTDEIKSVENKLTGDIEEEQTILTKCMQDEKINQDIIA